LYELIFQDVVELSRVKHEDILEHRVDVDRPYPRSVDNVVDVDAGSNRHKDVPGVYLSQTVHLYVLLQFQRVKVLIYDCVALFVLVITYVAQDQMDALLDTLTCVCGTLRVLKWVQMNVICRSSRGNECYFGSLSRLNANQILIG
jgi:hypothetical protein